MPEQFEPWFGTWPPECYGGEQEMEDTRTVVARAIKLAVVGVVGFACVIGSLWLSTTWQILLATIGSAFIVVFGFGCTVDWWLKKGILDDVVKASLGYMVPKELRPAMEWVYTQHIICTQHVQQTEITRSKDSNTVIARTRMVRTLENIGGATETVDILLGINEWLEDTGHSEILELAYDQEDKHVSLLERQTRGACAIRIDKHPVELHKGKTLTILSEWTEVKRATDCQCGFLVYPTQTPLVSVKAPDGIGIWVEFTLGHNQEGKTDVKATRYLGNGVYKLNATILPLQPIQVCWYEKQKCQEWLDTPQKPSLSQPNQDEKHE